MLTFRLSCCRICSKYSQHWHHASLLISNMLYWSSGSWRCYQLLLLGQLPRGRFRPESSHSPCSPFPSIEELRRASNPTPRTTHLWSCVAKHTITIPARWVRAAAPLEGPFGSTLGQKSPLFWRITKQIPFKLPQQFIVCRCPTPGVHRLPFFENSYKPENNVLWNKGWPLNCVLYVESLLVKPSDLGLRNRSSLPSPVESPYSIRCLQAEQCQGGQELKQEGASG